MAVLRENVPLLDQCITLYAGHQTSDPVGKRWARSVALYPSRVPPTLTNSQPI